MERSERGPRIIDMAERKLVGMRMTMSLAEHRVGELWRRFMPRRKEVTNALGNDRISVAIYGSDFFADLQPMRTFERWATVEVPDFANVPAGMETLIVHGGRYAAFHYRGPSTDNSIFRHIHGTWLPGSAYALDDRPHFEVLGDRYRNNDPTSEEEIWIPIRPK
ncbi:MAG: GyrI-like domain-containing protein [Flavobacteriales bacterium]|nr:GyrI-like domain-containing protein [Flavobacteriales bacterium]MCB9166409.1 GyrI-like domain-containing protein [Flavobacteriales bacterium]